MRDKGEIVKKFEFELSGLDCITCAMKIENNVKHIEGINDCAVNFVMKKLTFSTAVADTDKVVKNVVRLIEDLEPGIRLIDLQQGQAKGEAISEKMLSREIKIKIFRMSISTVLLLLASFGDLQYEFQMITFLAAYLIVGLGVLKSAVKNMMSGQVFTEYFLMSIATIGAFIIGEYPEAVAVMLFYQIGELFQGLAVNRSRKSISDLMDVRPDFAHVKRNGSIEKVSPEGVQIGDIIIVKVGEKIPLDGFIRVGFSTLDTSALTGESLPKEVSVNDEVLSGFINKQSVIEVEVTKTFGESTVSKILDLVENASTKKTPTERFITKFAKIYTPVVVLIAAVVAIVPPLLLSGESFEEWLHRALIFLVISCPCALVVSVPLGFFGGIGAASRNGILVKGGDSLDALNNVKYAVFDKTGTLTKGKFHVVGMFPANDIAVEELLETAAYAEKLSNHPIAHSIVERYHGEIDLANIMDFTELAGYGIQVKVKSDDILAGNHKLMDLHQVQFFIPDEVGNVIHLARNNTYLGCLVIADELKSDAVEAISSLKKLGIKKTMMLTGDSKDTALSIAKSLNLDDFYAELLPHQKVEYFERIVAQKQKKEKVIFVGDGINDAPVLARADLGIAMGGLGSDAAVEVADIVIMTDEPAKVAQAINIAKETRKIVWQNITLAFVVKGFFLTLALFGVVTMWEAVIADVGVTLVAVLNSSRILKKRF